jgi:drug/metabolite transporter (DMT)-like permease
MLLTAFFFSLMNVFVNLSGDLPTIQKSFFRNIISAIFALSILLKTNQTIRMPKKGKGILILRSLFGTLGIICNFYAVDHLVLADATMLNKMSPFFAIIFSYLFLREKITFKQIMMVSVAFLGSLLIIKPSFNLEMIPYLIALIGGISAGAAYTCVRKLGSLKVTGPFVVFFFSAFSSILNLPFMLLNFQTMEIIQIIYLLLAGLCAAAAQFSITTAYFNAPAKEISIFDYSQIIFSALLGYILFNQTIDLYSLIGYLIIISMAFTMFKYNNSH